LREVDARSSIGPGWIVPVAIDPAAPDRVALDVHEY
jgi:hypothetical protein